MKLTTVIIEPTVLSFVCFINLFCFVGMSKSISNCSLDEVDASSQRGMTRGLSNHHLSNVTSTTKRTRTQNRNECMDLEEEDEEIVIGATYDYKFETPQTPVASTRVLRPRTTTPKMNSTSIKPSPSTCNKQIIVLQLDKCFNRLV